MSESRAIVPLEVGGRIAAIVPRSFAECWEQSQILARSKLVPTVFHQKPEDICVAIMHGLEVGLLPNQALASIAVINGRPTLWGDGMLAVVRGSGLVESFEETDDGQTATCAVKRRGEPRPTVRQFSLEDAKRAGLLGKQGPWTQYPQRMRQMRARSWALRDGFADVLKGLYSAEEAQDIPVSGPPRDITPPRAEAGAPPPAVPDIPDAPATPPPDVPDADASTGEVARTDAEFLVDLDGAFATAGGLGALAEHVEANKAEVEARGVEQAANDLVEKHRARLTPKPKPAAKPKAAPPEKTEAEIRMEETYVAIARSMRNADSLETLAEVWKLRQADIRTLPAVWQQELAAEKDRHKAKLQSPTQGTAA
ncbi:MAG TPA: recombinase RecT [Hyphomicrobiaceae bacterium]|jgi:hypothetical protein